MLCGDEYHSMFIRVSVQQGKPTFVGRDQLSIHDMMLKSQRLRKALASLDE